jgi:ABC-type sugar transport system substrate-binding protein
LNANIKVRYVVVGYWLRDKTEERVEEILNKKPAADLVFSHNDAMAIGAWRVAQQKKLNLKYIGIGGKTSDADGIAAVKRGSLQATFVYPTGGKEALQYAVKILEGEDVPQKYELKPVMVTKEDLK